MIRRGVARGGRVGEALRARLVSVAIAALALASIFAPLGVPHHDGDASAVAGARQRTRIIAQAPTVRRIARRQLPRVQVTIQQRPEGIPVPRSFLGLSTEYWAMPLFERRMPLFERVLSLVHAPGSGPFVLRIGGDSADQAVWDLRVRRVPKEIVALTPSWFRRTSALVRAVGAELILDLNLVTDLPSMAAQWARAAFTELPPRSIIGFEIGNEPDLYDGRFWSSIYAPLRREVGLLPSDFSPSDYAAIFQSYARALAKFAPHVPLVGPVVANPARDLNWISRLLAAPHPGLGIVSGHRYPYSACTHDPFSPTYPTVAGLLSEKATAGMARALRPAVWLAHRAGLPFRLTELNSVTCGGLAGVSNTFATALWAPDALFELLRVGVDGVNVHVRPYTINAAFALTPQGLRARPLLYGLILFARTLGPGAQLLDVRLSASHAEHVKVWAARIRGRELHVLLINKGNLAVSVGLRLPSRRPATVQRLLAPSVAASSGVTLDGQRLGPDGEWHGRAVSETITPGATGYELTLPPTSAALVDIKLIGARQPL